MRPETPLMIPPPSFFHPPRLLPSPVSPKRLLLLLPLLWRGEFGLREAI